MQQFLFWLLAVLWTEWSASAEIAPGRNAQMADQEMAEQGEDTLYEAVAEAGQSAAMEGDHKQCAEGSSN